MEHAGPALKRIARIKHIQETLIQQWSVLATLTPTEYAEFRGFLANSSGFQSHQYRAIEFILGNKNPDMLQVFDHGALRGVAEEVHVRGSRPRHRRKLRPGADYHQLAVRHAALPGRERRPSGGVRAGHDAGRGQAAETAELT